MSDAVDDHTLAHDMVEVHGEAAVTVARSNARSAAFAGRIARAKSWIRVLAIIPRQASKPQKPEIR
jgi:hypothetical protein